MSILSLLSLVRTVTYVPTTGCFFLTGPPLKISSFWKQQSSRISWTVIFSALPRVQEILGLYCLRGGTSAGFPLAHYTLYTILYTIYYTLYTIHFTLYTIHFTLSTLHFTLYTLHYTLYTLHFTLYTTHFCFFCFCWLTVV